LLELYVICWMVFSISLLYYFFALEYEKKKSYDFSVGFLTEVISFYFLSFFTWHILTLLLISDPVEFKQQIVKTIKESNYGDR